MENYWLLIGISSQFLVNLPIIGPKMPKENLFFQLNNFLTKIKKFQKKVISFSLENQHLTKLWRIWLKNWGCHALKKMKIEMGMAG